VQRCAAWFVDPALRLDYGRAGFSFARQNTWRDAATRFLDVLDGVVSASRRLAADAIGSAALSR
jgi:hypothetical protein